MQGPLSDRGPNIQNITGLKAQYIVPSWGQISSGTTMQTLKLSDRSQHSVDANTRWTTPLFNYPQLHLFPPTQLIVTYNSSSLLQAIWLLPGKSKSQTVTPKTATTVRQRACFCKPILSFSIGIYIVSLTIPQGMWYRSWFKIKRQDRITLIDWTPW